MARPVTTPVNTFAKQAQHSADIYDLQRRIATPPQTLTAQPTFIFSQPGTVAVELSAPHRYAIPTVMRLIVVDLVTAGSSNTVLEFSLNGAAAFETVTIGSGANNSVTEIGVYYGGVFDYVQCEITTAGTGAAGMSAHIFTTI